MSTGLRFCMVTTFYPPYSYGGDGITVQRLATALVHIDRMTQLLLRSE